MSVSETRILSWKCTSEEYKKIYFYGMQNARSIKPPFEHRLENMYIYNSRREWQPMLIKIRQLQSSSARHTMDRGRTSVYVYLLTLILNEVNVTWRRTKTTNRIFTETTTIPRTISRCIFHDAGECERGWQDYCVQIDVGDGDLQDALFCFPENIEDAIDP